MPTEYGEPQGCNDAADLNVALRRLVEAISRKPEDLRNLINGLNSVSLFLSPGERGKRGG
jgi:hypothetical protein